MENEFLIMGCHRTGTTLMKFILETHPDIFCHGEASAYEILLQNQTTPTTKPLVGLQVSGMIEHVPLISRKIYPIVTLTRNVVDVVSSLNNLEIPRGNMLNDYIVPLIEKRAMTDYMFFTNMSKEIEILEKHPKQSENYNAAAGALHYKWVLFLIDQYKKTGYPVCQVAYEQLVSTPEPVLRSVCDFLCVDWNENLLKHHEYKKHSDIGKNGLTLGKNDCTIPIGQYAINKGYLSLSKNQIAAIEGIVHA